MHCKIYYNLIKQSHRQLLSSVKIFYVNTTPIRVLDKNATDIVPLVQEPRC